MELHGGIELLPGCLHMVQSWKITVCLIGYTMLIDYIKDATVKFTIPV